MKSMQFSTHVNKNSMVQLQLSPEFSDKEVDLVIVIQKKPNHAKTDWQRFIDNTYGCLADDNLVRPEQLPIEERLELL